MSDLKITNGVWVAYDNHIMIEGNKVNKVAICMSKKDTLKFNDPDPEMEANAALICEAGNVYNETGLTPRELVEQRDKLLAYCDYMTSDYTDDDLQHYEYSFVSKVKEAQQLIALLTTKTK